MDESKSSKLDGDKPKSKHARKSKRESTGRKHPDKKEVEAIPANEGAAHYDRHGNETTQDKDSVEIEPTHAEPSMVAPASGVIDVADEDSSEWHSVSARKTRKSDCS